MVTTVWGPYCYYCGFGYRADPGEPKCCHRAECRRRYDSMDFPCYAEDGKQWCMYPERHLAPEYRAGSRRFKHPQKLLI